MTENERMIAEAMRRACIDAAIAAYEDGGLRGLCAEGRWELAIDAMRALDLGDVTKDLTGTGMTG